MGSSFQQEVGTGDIKKFNASMHREGQEIVVDVDSQWKYKGRSTNISTTCKPVTFKKIFEPGTNFTRKNEDGCPVSVKVERTLKLREEDFRAKPYNILSNTKQQEGTWRGCFKDQLTNLDAGIPDTISVVHTEKKQISCAVTDLDKQNET
jgi:hypothetical protein